VNLDDYKNSILILLGKMVDSNLVKPSDYQAYYSKFFLEARQELKKQAIAEKQKAIEKAEESKEPEKPLPYYSLNQADADEGNDDLSLYAKLLLPFWDTNPNVATLIGQMLRSNDKRLKYNTLQLLIKHDKPYPDSLLTWFAKLDEYRYELYTDLKNIGMPEKFPSLYNNHFDLGKSALLKKTYEKPDTIVYIDRLPVSYKGKDGYFYFYKYKTKKEDINWKLATVGLTPLDPRQFEYEDSLKYKFDSPLARLREGQYISYDFTELTDTKLLADEPIDRQLNRLLKKKMYATRKSAKEFYDEKEFTRTTSLITD